MENKPLKNVVVLPLSPDPKTLRGIYSTLEEGSYLNMRNAVLASYPDKIFNLEIDELKKHQLILGDAPVYIDVPGAKENEINEIYVNKNQELILLTITLDKEGQPHAKHERNVTLDEVQFDSQKVDNAIQNDVSTSAKPTEEIDSVQDLVPAMDWTNLKALKMGNMTDLIELTNLTGEQGFEIKSIFARLSIVHEPDGPTIRLDPVYNEIKDHPLLNQQEQDQLINGELANIKKISNNTKTAVIIEYDPQTRQFMSFDPTIVKAPSAINNQYLAPSEKEIFKNGNVLKLKDGTQVQYRYTDKNGMNANRSALVLTIHSEAVSKINSSSNTLIAGISPIIGGDRKQDHIYSEGLIKALEDLSDQLEQEKHKSPNDNLMLNERNLVARELVKAHNIEIWEWMDGAHESTKGRGR